MTHLSTRCPQKSALEAPNCLPPQELRYHILISILVDICFADAIEKTCEVPRLKRWGFCLTRAKGGRYVMFLVVAGDIRDNVVGALKETLNDIKTTVTTKTEFFV